MSGSSRKRSSRWDFKDDYPQHLSSNSRGDDYPEKSGSFPRDKEPEPGHSYAEDSGRNSSRRPGLDDEEHLKSKHENNQHSGEAWSRSRVSHNGDGMIGYYDRQSPVRDRHRNGSRSNSRSRSRSPVHRERRDAGSYDRQKSRARVSPQSSRDFDGRYKRGGDRQSDQSVEPGWEARNRKARDSKYYTDDFREQPMRGGRSDYSTDFAEDNSKREKRHLHDGISDAVLRRHRNELPRDREIQRRDSNVVPKNTSEGEFSRTSNIPCKFYAAGHCRNGNYCRFSHHDAARRSPDRKAQENMFGQDSNHSGIEMFRNGPKWNQFEKSDAGKSNEVETARGSTGISEPKVNRSWIDDMDMSPDWDYGVQTLNKPLKNEHGDISQSSHSLGLKEKPDPAYRSGEVKDSLWSHGSAAIPQNLTAENSYFLQDGNHRSTDVFPYGGKTIVEKPVSSHHNYNNAVNVAPVQGFNQNSHNYSALPYQNSLAVGGSQVLTTINLPGGLNSTNPETGKGYEENRSMEKPVSSDLESSKVINNANSATQNIVTTEQLNHISNISASLVQYFGNGQPHPLHYSTVNPQNAMQVPVHTESEMYEKQQSSMAIEPNQAIMFHSQNSPMVNPIQPKGNEMNAGTGVVPVVTASKIINTDGQLSNTSFPSAVLSINSESVPVDASCKLAEKPKDSEENKNKKTEESCKEDGKKTHDECEDAENADEDDKADENKKGKDPKGMRAFKFALVETVKELLKPSWREGRMSKDAYKNIVKKVVDKVTGTMQNGNIPQTQEKIEHYLSASKPKLTKLVEAYISKVKKS